MESIYLYFSAPAQSKLLDLVLHSNLIFGLKSTSTFFETNVSNHPRGKYNRTNRREKPARAEGKTSDWSIFVGKPPLIDQ